MKNKTTFWFKIAIENLPIKKFMIVTTLALLFPLVSFSQTVYTFTTAGATGRFGPTQGQCDTAYGVGVVTVNTQGIQEWTVPITGKYSLQALGAAGGNTTDYGASGGLGASMSGEFNLTAGQVLKIVVGQQGGSGPGAGSGGGGSFIVSNTNTPLLIAGGGGGKEYGGLTQSYQHGSILQNGQNTAYVSGGINGSGGSGDRNNGASGGGGFSGNGTDGMYGTFGFAFLNGAVGGDFTDWGYLVCVGGFGGGGGTHGNSGGGGGGGGYSGGAGGEHDEVGGNGGGGGSYNSGTNQTNVAGTNSGNGSVVITSLFSATISQSSNVVCDTDSTGELSVAVDGGTGPYTYIWVPNVSASSIASGLTAGTYNVTVTDANSLTTTASFTITSLDNVPPTIATLSAMNVNADAGVCTYTSLQLTAPTAADNCNVVSVVATPASLVLGANTVTWTVTDGSGLTATSTQTVTVIDAQYPTIATLSAMNVNADAGVCAYASSQLTVPTAADNCSVVSVVASPASLISGANTVTWTVTDGSGLTATSTQTVTVIDTENPTIATLSAINVNADSGVCTYASTQLTAPSAADNCSVLSVVASPASLISGVNTVTWTVTDGAGLKATSTQTVTVVDSQNPTIATLSAINVNADAGVCTYVSTQLTKPTAADNCSVVSVVASPASLVSGSNTVTWTVTDGAGLKATSTQTVTVVDSQNPTIATLSAINVNADAGVCTYASTQLTKPTAADNCSVVSVVASPASLVSGSNTVTWTVTDGAGLKATSVQTVTVVDNEAPVVVTKNKTIQLNAAGTASIVLADINNGSTDNCGISLVELDKTSFTCANIGANTVTLKVTDVNGNVATQTAIVTVEDKIAPVALTKNITVQLDASSNVTIATADVNNGSTDNCGIRLLELDRATFSCANVGDNTVTLKVTDNSGNVSTKTAIVTVVNTQPNLIRKHFDDVIFFDNSSASFKSYSWYKNGLLVSGQTAQYFKDSGVLNGTYYAMATKVDGTVVTTCPLTFSASVEVEYLKIAPNPVRSNSVYQLITNVDSARLQNARVTVFNMLGTLIMDSAIDKNAVEMVAPSVEGIYIVKMTLANGKYFTKNLLVKN